MPKLVQPVKSFAPAYTDKSPHTVQNNGIYFECYTFECSFVFFSNSDVFVRFINCFSLTERESNSHSGWINAIWNLRLKGD